jgi:hypothetical protein
MIILGCVKMDLLISRFDGKTVNGITYHLVSQQGIQAVFLSMMRKAMNRLLEMQRCCFIQILI